MASTAAKGSFRKIVATTFSPDFRSACKILPASFRQLGDDEVLIRNRFVGINATDINVSSGRYTQKKEPPIDVGLEGIGYAEDVGENVPKETLGKVFGYIWVGAFAEYIAIPHNALLPLPKADSMYVPLLISGLTAAISLDQFGKMEPGCTALITAAAGGTGHLAVQIAKQKGCHVIATCSSEQKAEFLKSIGADRVINLSKEKLGKVIASEYKKGLDLVYESIGGDVFQTCLNSLAMKGRLISLGYITSYQSPAGVERSAKNATIIQRLLPKSATISGFFLFNHRDQYRIYLPQLLDMCHQGQLKPHVELGNRRIPRFVGLESVFDGVEYLYSRESQGKIVVELPNPAESKL